MRAALLVLILLLPLQARADVFVSCRQYDVSETFEILREQNQEFMVVHGQAEFDPEHSARDAKETYEVSGRFIGKALGPFGFLKNFNEPVDFKFICSSGSPLPTICGHLAPEEELLVFLSKSDGAYSLEKRHCSATVYHRYFEDHKKMAHKCFLGVGCRSNYPLKDEQSRQN